MRWADDYVTKRSAEIIVSVNTWKDVLENRGLERYVLNNSNYRDVCRWNGMRKGRHACRVH